MAAMLSPSQRPRRSASRRNATLFPAPGSPAIKAKPPWRTRWRSILRQKLSTAGVAMRLSTGRSVAKGFHLSP